VAGKRHDSLLSVLCFPQDGTSPRKVHVTPAEVEDFPATHPSRQCQDDYGIDRPILRRPAFVPQLRHLLLGKETECARAAPWAWSREAWAGLNPAPLLERDRKGVRQGCQVAHNRRGRTQVPIREGGAAQLIARRRDDGRVSGPPRRDIRVPYSTTGADGPAAFGSSACAGEPLRCSG